MAAKVFSFRLSAEGAQQVVSDLKAVAGTSAQVDSALQTLIRSSPQLASASDLASAKLETLARSMQTTQANVATLGPSMQTLGETTTATHGAFSAFGEHLLSSAGIGAGFSLGATAAEKLVEVFGELLKAVPEAGDTFKLVDARLTAITGSSTLAATAYAALDTSARKTGISVEASSEGFVRLLTVTKDIGATSGQIAQLVTGIQELGIISGTSTAEVDRAVYDLSHGLASGVLQGLSLKALMQQMPALARDLATELGTTIGQLREMGSAGQLTTDVVFPALLRVSQKVGEEFEKMPPTIQRAGGILAASMNDFLVALDKALGLSTALAGTLKNAASALDATRRATFRTDAEVAQDNVSNAQKRLTAAQNYDPTAVNPGVSAANDLIDPSRPGQISDQGKEARIATAQKQLLDAINAQMAIRKQAREDAQDEADKAGKTQLEHEQTVSKTAVDQLATEFDKKLAVRQKYQGQVDTLNKAYSNGAIDKTQYDTLLAEATAAEDKALEKVEHVKALHVQAGKDINDVLNNLLDQQEKAAKAVEDAIDPEDKAYDTLTKRLKALTDATNLYFATQDRQGGPLGISPDRAAELTTLANDQYNNSIEKLSKTTDKATNSFDQFFSKQVSGFESAIAAGKGFSSVIQGLEKDIATLLTRTFITQPLTDALSKGGGSGLFDSLSSSLFGQQYGPPAPGQKTVGGGGFSGLINSLFSNLFAGGGVMTSAGGVPLKKYAGGGVANTPQLSIFGEGSQPEAYVPLPDGRRIPVAMQGNSGGGVQINHAGVNVTVTNTNASPEQIAAMVTLASNKANTDLLTQIERGGNIARQVGRRQS